MFTLPLLVFTLPVGVDTTCWCWHYLRSSSLLSFFYRVGQSRIWPYIWWFPSHKYRIPYTHRINMLLANPILLVKAWHWPRRSGAQTRQCQMCPLQYCFWSTRSRSQLGAGFRPSLQPSWSAYCHQFFLLLSVAEETWVTWYQSGSFSSINVGVNGFLLPACFFFLAYVRYRHGKEKMAEGKAASHLEVKSGSVPLIYAGSGFRGFWGRVESRHGLQKRCMAQLCVILPIQTRD